MEALSLLLTSSIPGGATTLVVTVIVLAIMGFFSLLVSRQYKRCPSNRVLVVYGRVGGERTSKCLHGGGVFVIPLLQNYAFLTLEPMTIDIDLTSALSKKNIRVNVPSTFTIGISIQREIMNAAAERLLGLTEKEIAAQARDIILGQMRLVIATLSIEEINQDRENLLDLVNKNVNFELNKIGLEVINVNIRDITDESGYIEALGQKAAAEAINKAKVEVAEAVREGDIGQASADRQKEVSVANERSQSMSGQKEAERNQRIAVARLEAEGVAGEAESQRSREVAIAEQAAKTVQATKAAEMEQRVRVAALEADATEGENTSRAEIASYNATLAEKEAEAQRRGQVAAAEAQQAILTAEREAERARLEKEQIVQQNIEKAKIEIDAEAEAERRRRIAAGEADAILAKYRAEAEGMQAVLSAKARGYQELVASCGDRAELAPSFLIIEQLPELISEQVKAIQNLKIDKITVWDSGANGSGNGESGGSTSNFLRGLIGSLPPMHELARQAGIDLPEILGTVKEVEEDDDEMKEPVTTGAPGANGDGGSTKS